MGRSISAQPNSKKLVASMFSNRFKQILLNCVFILHKIYLGFKLEGCHFLYKLSFHIDYARNTWGIWIYRSRNIWRHPHWYNTFGMLIVLELLIIHAKIHLSSTFSTLNLTLSFFFPNFSNIDLCLEQNLVLICDDKKKPRGPPHTHTAQYKIQWRKCIV